MKQSSGLKSKMESGDNAMISSIRFLYRRTEKAESDDRFAGSRVFAAILREELESHIVPEWFAIEAERDALKVENEGLREVVSDWIADISMNDGGALFHKDTPDDRRSMVSYGDLEKLIKMDYEAKNGTGKGE